MVNIALIIALLAMIFGAVGYVIFLAKKAGKYKTVSEELSDIGEINKMSDKKDAELKAKIAKLRAGVPNADGGNLHKP